MSNTVNNKTSVTEIIVLWAASYTGATWISFVLGSHEKVFSLGNIRRALDGLRKNPAETCVVHKKDCTFWPEFANQWNPAENLLIQLARYTGGKRIIVNNPRIKGGRPVINYPGLKITAFAIQRDLRALAASYMRKNRGIGIEQTIKDYLLRAADTMETDVKRDGVIVIDHGIASENHNYLLEKLKQGTGLDYTRDNLRFWEHDYHVVSSNAGTVGTVKAYQNMNQSHRQAYYDDFVKRIRENEKADVRFTDQRWQQELTRYDLFVIDQFVGEINDRLGYDRDKFTQEEIRQFSADMKKRLAKPGLAHLRWTLYLQGNVFGRLLTAIRHWIRHLAETYS